MTTSEKNSNSGIYNGGLLVKQLYLLNSDMVDKILENIADDARRQVTLFQNFIQTLSLLF